MEVVVPAEEIAWRKRVPQVSGHGLLAWRKRVPEVSGRESLTAMAIAPTGGALPASARASERAACHQRGR